MKDGCVCVEEGWKNRLDPKPAPEGEGRWEGGGSIIHKS